jgi:hypothetical protein
MTKRVSARWRSTLRMAHARPGDKDYSGLEGVHA